MANADGYVDRQCKYQFCQKLIQFRDICQPWPLSASSHHFDVRRRRFVRETCWLVKIAPSKNLSPGVSSLKERKKEEEEERGSGKRLFGGMCETFQKWDGRRMQPE